MSNQLFDLMTDSCCDLPAAYLKENQVDFVSMVINLEGKEYVDDLGEKFDYEYFINQLKLGKMPSTSQINIGTYLKVFEPYVDSKQPLLYVCFSSGLSGSYNNALMALAALKETHRNIPITIVDSKAASLGLGLLVYEVIALRNAGKNLTEVEDWLATNIKTLQSWVTVSDLNHLERGGRISKTAATVGGLVKVKPIIVVNEQGKLVNNSKVRGRRKSLEKLVAETSKNILSSEEQTIFIAYAGDLQAAEAVKESLLAELAIKEIKVMPMGPTIASHTGFGAIAIFSFGMKEKS